MKSFELILAVAVFNDTYEVSWYKIRDDLKIVSLCHKTKTVLNSWNSGTILVLAHLQKNPPTRILQTRPLAQSVADHGEC